MVGGIIVGVGRWIETMRQEVKQGYTMLAVLLVTLMLLGGVVPLLVGAAGSTSVRVSPTSQTVSAGQTFIVTVSCTPGQLIKSFECKVLFNSSLLQANSVTEGNIFHGYSTFFKNGTINNSAGTIIDVYGLILGTGSVSTSGTFISISFTARSASGTSTVGLSGVGVTNETNYVPITVTNGSVILREFTLGVALDGSGSVTQNPNLATYPYGTVVQLTATASSGWVFGSWTGDLSGTQNPKTITMTGNKSVTAHFTQAQYTLLITIQGSGTVTKVPDQASYTYGQVVQLTASPASGWMFNHWAGDLTGSTTPASVTMNGNRAVTANFTITSGYTLAITIQGSGTVTKVPDLTSYTYGQVVTLTANPSTGWVFNHWGGDLTGSASPTTITMNGNRAVTVNFTAIHYTLSLTIQGSGTVTRAPDQSWYTYGQVVQLTASPAAGWVFNHWAGDLTGSTTPASVTMNGNRAVTANFTITSGYTLAITVQGSGTVTKVPDLTSYTYGQVVTLTANPSTGWVFNHWGGDLTGSASPTTITMNGNRAVTVNFTAIHYTLSLTIQGSGTVTRAPDQSWYTYGQVVQLTASPAAGWVFNHWAGDLTGSTTPASVTMNGNRAVTANFTITSGYTLAITVQGSGTVTKNPNRASYVYGEVVTLTAVPSTGWMFSSWTGDLTGSQNPKTITMNGNKAVAASFSDSAPSQISGVSRTSSTPLDVDPLYGWVNVSCTVTDNVGVSQVILKIHTPGGSWNNVSMLTHTTSKYYYRSTTAFSAAGNYSYSIWAKDTSNNTNSSSSVLFSMPPNWDINNDGICNILDLVNISNHYSESGPLGWIREDADNNGEVQVIDLVNVSNHLDESWW